MKMDLKAANIVPIFLFARCVTVEKHNFLLRMRKNGTLFTKKMSKDMVTMWCNSRAVSGLTLVVLPFNDAVLVPQILVAVLAYLI